MEINLGDVFYFIERTDFRRYREKCRGCGDTHKATINGVTFDCPVCNLGNEKLSVCGYEVRHFRVYSIGHFSENSCWKDTGIRHLRYELYRTKQGNQRILRKTLNGSKFKKINTSLEDIKDCLAIISEFPFSDYKLAVSIADELTAQNRDSVRRYNEEHGTNFELPDFNINHDNKENNSKHIDDSKNIPITESMDFETLADWYINSVDNTPPIWTEQHLKELLNDFYVIPKDTQTDKQHSKK